METDILPVDPNKLGRISVSQSHDALVDEWTMEYTAGKDLDSMLRAAQELATSDVPVAFPTETVYGLGADATRSSAVRAIFAAKGRPADNPLIIHVCSVAQLKALLRPAGTAQEDYDPIPEVYKPLIQRFWPGPLTIILPNPRSSALSPEVTAGLSTFGARMPRSILALALIQLAGVPLAAPSANASTRPSPTAAEHVKDDLGGRIHTIIDGGPCEVGVESTVVDGLSYPPTILRPGGITVEQLRKCPGWEDVLVGYNDSPEKGLRPKAPGMKYRHYSPNATVFLYEAGARVPEPESVLKLAKTHGSIGIIRTKRWPIALSLPIIRRTHEACQQPNMDSYPIPVHNGQTEHLKTSNILRSVIQHQAPYAEHLKVNDDLSRPVDVYDVGLGADVNAVAHGLFSALRELDKKGVGVIFVEGIDDKVGDDIAAAVMNRLRKAAEIRA
ncbi:translation factor [Lindgomyces ingoldianus]|uniref:Translation factor n=1 Tax=Lindgomyces ingoldianus TaxID=673940 RepID=A0ACB6REM5_9PLEO|nr:translation factor [Lindgomyces ingoldianus]KAF2477799.1 translation factor [Lindgomyces ingoldianus]